MFDFESFSGSPFGYRRRKTCVVFVGDVGIGGDNPIRVQSMTIADTMDTRATVDEVIRLVEVGCEIVRITAPSIREAENLKNIKAELLRRGVRVPLVADIHYTPNAALIAADHVEKVRINPGNYADKKRFEQREYTDEEYQAELRRIEEKFQPLVLKCKALGKAMRIGTNHGSLSDRIMNRYGDTPEGMVESALEFVRICQKYDYHDLILSMKASNPQVAIQAYRRLAARMDELGMDYPFHLGVTEAGDGEEGRIKSAVGIGSLLEDGIGDTIRVSLTEDAEAEVPVAFKLVEKYNRLNESPERESLKLTMNGEQVILPDPVAYQRRATLKCDTVYYQLGSEELPRVELTVQPLQSAVRSISEMLDLQSKNGLTVLGQPKNPGEFKCEALHFKPRSPADVAALAELKQRLHSEEIFIPLAIDVTETMDSAKSACRFADRIVYSPDRRDKEADLHDLVYAAQSHGKPIEWMIGGHSIESFEANDEIHLPQIGRLILRILQVCEKRDYWNVMFSLSGDLGGASYVNLYRYLAGRLDALGASFPILLRYRSDNDLESTILNAASQLGSLLCDGIGDAIHLEADLAPKDLLRLSYNILQATRLRISKTEFISCPSCGRTLFNLQTTTERIKSKTGHLKGVKIAIMGCIVNGPGEMADADFGYVGAGPKKVNLFVGKECVERNIPEERADERLIELIKSHGKWVDRLK